MNKWKRCRGHDGGFLFLCISGVIDWRRSRPGGRAARGLSDGSTVTRLYTVPHQLLLAHQQPPGLFVRFYLPHSLIFSSACCGSRAPGAISYHRSRRSFFPPLSAMSCVTHFPDADSFQRQSDEFIAWLAQRPGVRISPKIRVADLRSQGAGRGVGMFLISFFNFPLSAFLRSFSLLRPWTPLIRSKQSLAPTSSTVRNYSPSPATWSSPSGIPSSRT